MRTDDPRPRATRFDPLGDRARHAWRWLSSRGPRARLWAAGAALAVLVAAGYYAAVAPSESTETTWLLDGTVLAPDDARRILSALAVAKIPASPAARGQIAVSAAKRADALALLTKQKLLPKNLHEIKDEAAHASMFDFPVDRADQRDRHREQEAEHLIGRFDGIESAEVSIQRSTSRAPGSRGVKVGALVSLQTRDNRPLPPQSLQAIRSVLKNAEPDLPDDALTVLDKSGRPYVLAGNPEAGAAMMAHAREEELRGNLLQALNWIEGVRVLVSLEAPTLADADGASSIAPAVVVNGPADAEVASPPAVKPPVVAKARILVQVPITYYLRGRREATLDELKPYAAKVEESIRAAVLNGVPAAELASLKIDRINAAGPELPAVGSADSTTIRLPGWVVPAAGGAIVALVALVLMGTRWMVARRPATVAAAVPRAHFEVTDDAGPSGRVRDLVRRDPAAAAGVLGRWIGQGGQGS